MCLGFAVSGGGESVNLFFAGWRLGRGFFHGGSKGGMKVGGVEEISPNIVESTIGTI